MLLAATWLSPCYQQGMTTYLPTHQALIDVARLLELEPNDPAVVAAFDALVLRGHLKPFVPDWWELSRELSQRITH